MTSEEEESRRHNFSFSRMGNEPKFLATPLVYTTTQGRKGGFNDVAQFSKSTHACINTVLSLGIDSIGDAFV